MAESYFKTEMSTLFLAETAGLRMNFAGCLQVSDVDKVDGVKATHYCYIGNLAIPIGDTTGMPEPLKITISGPLELLKAWLNRECPFLGVIGWRKCEPNLGLTKWDASFDHLFYLPHAKIERKGLTSPATRGPDEVGSINMGRVVIHVADWLVYERHEAWEITTAIDCAITALAFCGGPVCASSLKECNQPWEAGCCRIWVGGVGDVDSGCLRYTDDCFATIVDKEGAGAGQIDLANVGDHYDVLAIYCEGDVVIVADEAEVIHYSHDRGETWDTSADAFDVDKFVAFYDNIYAAGADGLYVSKDDGVTWTELVDAAFVDMDWCEENGVGVAITATATYLSFDGVRWYAATASGMVDQAKVQILPDGRIFVAGPTKMIYTRDQGVTWMETGTAAHVCNFLFKDDYVGWRLFDVTNGEDHPLEITLDGGYTWHEWTLHGWTDEEICEIVMCDDRLLMGGTAGFLAEQVIYAPMIVDPGTETDYP